MSISNRIEIVTVPLGERRYDIMIGADILKTVGMLVEKYDLPKQTVIITDRNVAPLHLPVVERSLRRSGCSVVVITIPPGEKEKSLHRAGAIFTQLLRLGIPRRSTIIALGGGVVGDLAGFIAATYQRGVSFVQIPTTLLSQVDSSVGGKVGINHPLGKNMIGAFYQPAFVLADVTALRTLPSRELVCGLGEIIKYGIILDAEFFHSTQQHLARVLRCDPAALRTMVKACCSMKSFVVSRDERENGSRAILNFGHTVGHALEKAGQYRSLKHGEAVLWGMLAETLAAQSLGMINEADVRRICDMIASVPLPPLPRATFGSLASTMRLDKKAVHGKILCVLPTRIGAVTLPMVVEESVLENVVRQMRRYKL